MKGTLCRQFVPCLRSCSSLHRAQRVSSDEDQAHNAENGAGAACTPQKCFAGCLELQALGPKQSIMIAVPVTLACTDSDGR